MIVEIINTGAELLLGRTMNTHQLWLCRRLSDLGHEVTRQVAVPDVAESIANAVRESLSRADAVITTGGLGPTSDDRTRETIATMLNRPLREDSSVLRVIEQRFRTRNRTMPDRARVQAMVPDGAEVLANAAGTAPGLAIELTPNPHRLDRKKSLLIMLPGPPRELHPMFDTLVVRLLARVFGEAEAFICHTLRTTGVPESLAEERIHAPLAELMKHGLAVGYCARPGEVDVRLEARGARAEQIVSDAAAIVREAMPTSIYSETGESLEAAVVRLLTEQSRTLAIAESCTGGLISNRVTDVPGASKVLLASLVTYSNAAKQQVLGISGELIATHGAVSEAVARAMAEGARRVTGADLSVAVTGIAGPSGGTAAKPVGTVFISMADAADAVVLSRQNRWDRETFKRVTSQQALDLVRRRLSNLPFET